MQLVFVVSVSALLFSFAMISAGILFYVCFNRRRAARAEVQAKKNASSEDEAGCWCLAQDQLCQTRKPSLCDEQGFG